MKILLLGSIALRIPPNAQGGTEWISYYQAKGVSKRGHEVILIAAKGTAENFKDSNVKVIEIGEGDVVTGSRAGLTYDPKSMESSRRMRTEMIYLGQVTQVLIDQKDNYDVIINNMRGEAVFLPIAKILNKPFVNVLHLNLFPKLAEMFATYNTMLISISNSQKRSFPDLNFIATIYNGVDVDAFAFSESTQEFLFTIGSIGGHKSQRDAIDVAKKAETKLILAGKIRDEDYFESIKPDIDGNHVQWAGEVDFNKKIELYKSARALLFPISWEEPFGLVMIEAMSCGTPVIAYNRGSVAEVVKDGVTGFIIDPDDTDRPGKGSWVIKQKGIDGLVEAVKRIGEIDRKACREHVEQNFSVEKMVDGYEKVYQELLGK